MRGPGEHYFLMVAVQLAGAIAQGLSSVAFGWYGTSALLSRRLVPEFERYGLAHLRVPIATLQIAGSAGLLAGFLFRPLLLLSAGGLAAMMLLALVVRVRIRDPIVAMLPASLLLGLNLLALMAALSDA